ncbi:MAG TPA: hypothetical protein VFS70_04770 [Actinomycetota bacterium]|nr:hypothetical protein [Actinomycetota bacterium]
MNDVEWPVEMEAGAGANEHVTLSTPTLGRVESLTNDQGGAILSSFQRGGVAPRLAKILERSIWHAPESVRAEFRTFTLTGIRQESGTAPSAPFRTEWSAKETLKAALRTGARSHRAATAPSRSGRLGHSPMT